MSNFTVELPFGWRLISPLIAFFGLFLFAGATAVAIGMARQLFDHFDKHKSLHQCINGLIELLLSRGIFYFEAANFSIDASYLS